MVERGGHPDGRRRSRRDWVVDSIVFVLAVLLGLFLFVISASTPVEGTGFAPYTRVTVALDLVLGAVSCTLLWWRRRAPVALALLVTFLSLGSATSAGAVGVLVFTVAVHRSWRWNIPVAAANVVVSVAYVWLWDDGTLGWVYYLVGLVTGTAMLAAVIAAGMLTRARRQLVASLRERAERAEAEQQRSAQAARLGERTRIAREMHDVLAHRMSLVSMHAGALEYRRDATADEVTAAAGVIRENAHHALEDLREVIGVLRAEADAEVVADASRPQPTLAGLPALLAECRGAGLTVRESVDVPSDVDPPLTTSRTAYRVLQEGLTNARKHGRGGVVDVCVAGRPGDGLQLEVRNALRPGGSPEPDLAATPGGGNGLVGLAERTRLASGRMEHGVVDDTFRLRVWLPWT